VLSNRSRLPQLKFLKFTGACADWASFYFMFVAVIQLTSIEKFQHLVSCLSGIALETVTTLEIEDANYQVALDVLKKRFDNKRLIIQGHIRQIFVFERVDSSSTRCTS